jgi:carboxynorspermidine decarboxylase
MATDATILGDLISAHPSIQTPYYLIDVSRLQRNLDVVAAVRERAGVKCVLALKAFSTWSVFPAIAPYLDGTTSSSPFEARLGYETFGKEVHAYSVGFTDADFDAILPFANKIIFNSPGQLERFAPRASGIQLGIRINPGIGNSAFELADPVGRFSRLGVTDVHDIARVLPLVSGAMFHCNCENSNLASFTSILEHIGRTFGDVLRSVEWVSLGGGIAFTKPGYPVDAFCDTLRAFAERFDVQLYLEPGDAVVADAGFLVTRVVDLVCNEAEIAVVDAGVEAHFLDLLVYQMEARVALPEPGAHPYIVAGRSCLAGDVFGRYSFARPLAVGDPIVFADAAQYTMVKKNWFNGLAMPAIVARQADGRVEVVRSFGYEEYRASLS